MRALSESAESIQEFQHTAQGSGIAAQGLVIQVGELGPADRTPLVAAALFRQDLTVFMADKQ